jgi:hypothetical protein
MHHLFLSDSITYYKRFTDFLHDDGRTLRWNKSMREKIAEPNRMGSMSELDA